MKQRPILFSAPMVRALLDGSKTQTRRVMKVQPVLNGHFWEVYGTGWSDGVTSVPAIPEHSLARNCPYGLVGDRFAPAIPLPEYDRRYCVDVFGRIWSRAQGEWKVLTPGTTSKGYQTVTPARDGTYATRSVHRLVCEAFYGKSPKGLNQVRHLNGDQTDNAPENLDWGTHEQNWCDRAAHGKGMGESHHGSKLSQADVDAIRSSSLSQRKLASAYNVSQSLIQSVKTHGIWVTNRKPAAVNMPRWASRITLEITGIRVERLQHISEEDALAEGASGGHGAIPGYQYSATPLEHFKHIWQSTGGDWDANPWVWVLDFKRVEQ